MSDESPGRSVHRFGVEAAREALEVLHKLVTDETVPAAARIQAACALLDRFGLPPRIEVVNLDAHEKPLAGRRARHPLEVVRGR